MATGNGKGETTCTIGWQARISVLLKALCTTVVHAVVLDLRWAAAVSFRWRLVEGGDNEHSSTVESTTTHLPPEPILSWSL